MQIINLIGDRLYLDCLITDHFNFSFENNEISVNYKSQLTIEQIDQKIEQLKYELIQQELQESKNPDLLFLYKESILILENLKLRLK